MKLNKAAFLLMQHRKINNDSRQIIFRQYFGDFDEIPVLKQICTLWCSIPVAILANKSVKAPLITSRPFNIKREVPGNIHEQIQQFFSQ